VESLPATVFVPLDLVAAITGMPSSALAMVDPTEAYKILLPAGTMLLSNFQSNPLRNFSLD
jgi:hypothetical protein